METYHFLFNSNEANMRLTTKSIIIVTLIYQKSLRYALFERSTSVAFLPLPIRLPFIEINKAQPVCIVSFKIIRVHLGRMHFSNMLAGCIHYRCVVNWNAENYGFLWLICMLYLYLIIFSTPIVFDIITKCSLVILFFVMLCN